MTSPLDGESEIPAASNTEIRYNDSSILVISLLKGVLYPDDDTR